MKIILIVSLLLLLPSAAMAVPGEMYTRDIYEPETLNSFLVAWSEIDWKFQKLRALWITVGFLAGTYFGWAVTEEWCKCKKQR